MNSSDEKSLKDFEKEPPEQIESKDFVTDVVIIVESADETLIKIPPLS